MHVKKMKELKQNHEKIEFRLSKRIFSTYMNQNT